MGGLLRSLLPVLGGMLAGGGLQKVLAGFQANGLSAQTDSWIGTGENQPISGEDVRKAVGDEELAKIAARARRLGGRGGGRGRAGPAGGGRPGLARRAARAGRPSSSRRSGRSSSRGNRPRPAERRRSTSRNSPRATVTACPPTSTRSISPSPPSARAYSVDGRPIAAPCEIMISSPQAILPWRARWQASGPAAEPVAASSPPSQNIRSRPVARPSPAKQLTPVTPSATTAAMSGRSAASCSPRPERDEDVRGAVVVELDGKRRALDAEDPEQPPRGARTARPTARAAPSGRTRSGRTRRARAATGTSPRPGLERRSPRAAAGRRARRRCRASGARRTAARSTG